MSFFYIVSEQILYPSLSAALKLISLLDISTRCKRHVFWELLNEIFLNACLLQKNNMKTYNECYVNK